MAEPMNVYRVEDGATYCVAAKNMGDAFAAVWKHWQEAEEIEDVETGSGVTIELFERKRWPEWYYDDGLGRMSSFPDLVAAQTEAAVLTCSEWP